MKNVYDNGEIVLGEVKNVIDYIQKNMEYTSEEDIILNDLIKELKEYYVEDTIVAITYGYGMGYSIEYWTKKNKVKVEK